MHGAGSGWVGEVSTHSRPKAAGPTRTFLGACYLLFQHTAARRRLESIGQNGKTTKTVSTHSRPKAAGSFPPMRWIVSIGFNTQPPEGGWQQQV